MLLERLKALEKLPDRQKYLYLREWMANHGIKTQTHEYATGRNLYVPSPQKNRIGVGSHYDTVPMGPGANDNLSAVVVATEIARRLKAHPTRNFGVEVYFFDEEENGLVGSRHFLKENDTDGILGLINMEMVGSGDQFAIWPVDHTNNGTILEAFEASCLNNSVNTIRIDRVVMNTADHLSFRSKGIMDSFTISCITNQDLEVAKEYYQGIADGLSQIQLHEIIDQAPIFAHYHKATDRSEHLKEQSLQMTVDAIWDTLHSLDALADELNG